MPRRPKILLADDDASLLMALKIRLEKAGAEVVTATDGYNSLAKARSEQPDLLILDVNMPAGDGFSVLERLEKMPSGESVPVIYLTGDHSERLDELAENLGAYAIFHKPINTKQLIESVYSALLPKAA
jgi:DNA-binding response OmpR family regulator